MAPLNGDFSKLLVGLGSNFRDMMTYLPVVRVIIHENFVQVQDGDDVALIELPLELIFESNDVVQPVCLAEAEDLMPGKDMVTTGWGFLFPFANSLPNDLFEVSVTQVDANICTYFTEIPSDQGKVVCTINMAKSTCIGDSGGPLVVQLCDGRWVQTGITSYGESGCSQPRVFASVSYYKNWIIDKIKPTTIC
ncbi:tryptase beta-2-like [Portunus trituberculatus]|uniref:tryptase beta-2-like n=1 Tax=Portunus trituberculatus TaxID=210409 RepID=UPI001E1CC887|nr:tryptase beta-2-like [Portunus trituberculatus]XP_045107305.1 tryptase beta-2-like [Portunus trituberculatus]